MIPENISTVVERRVALTDGLVRVIVTAAENPDDVLRSVCLETLVEIGMSCGNI
jgi:rapamycin-insensitive companion of mTOR